VKNFKHYNANSIEHAATVARHLALRGKAGIAPMIALLMITVSLGSSGCSRSKANNQSASTGPKLSSESVATRVAAPVPIVVPVTKAPEVAKKKSVQGPVKKSPSTLTYTDESAGISFKYPRSAKLEAGQEAELDSVAQGRLPMNFVQPGGMTMAIVELPDSVKSGTSATQLFSVRVNKQLSAEQCGQFAAQKIAESEKPASDPLPEEAVLQTLVYKQAVQGVDYTEFAQQVKGGEVKYYHRFLPESAENGACYEFGLAVTTEEKQDVGNAAVDSTAERKNVFMKLEKILATVNIKSAARDEVTENVKTASKIDESSR
jgi:hypothetical protein